MITINLFKKNKKILVTHNGTFHADDLFATATLALVFNGNIKVIRTRDEEIIKKADFVYDVGGIYNPEKNLFDHHQKEGAGKRENGIPYASFGLVWKKFGKKICGSQKVADEVDQKLVQLFSDGDMIVRTYPWQSGKMQVNSCDFFKLTSCIDNIECQLISIR